MSSCASWLKVELSGTLTKLYCIVRDKNNIRNREAYDYLAAAASARSITFVTLESDKFDYVHGFDSLDGQGIVYRLSPGERPALLEAMLVLRGYKGLYNGLESMMARRFPWGSTIRMQSAGVPIIPTVYSIRSDDVRLGDYVDSLGGFPVVAKESGGSHGSGVKKLDTLESLSDFLRNYKRDGLSRLVLRKFIDSARHIRVVVLGDRAVDVIEYLPQSDDFRTNAVDEPTVIDRNDIEPSIRQIAVDAVLSHNMEFGGVDVLIDSNGEPYVAEVNFPCNFARNQMTTGTDIAGLMVDYLVNKIS